MNNANELLGEAYSGGTLNNVTVSSAYDQYLRRNSLSAQYSTTPILQYSYAYDYASRLQTVTDNTGANPYSATYSYLANSPLIQQIVFANNGSA